MNEQYRCKICGKEIYGYEHEFNNDTCFDCRKKQKDEELAKALQANEETETCWEDEIVCPCCGHRIEDDDGFFVREQEGEYECYECGKTFHFEVDIEVTYSTQRKEIKND